MSTAALSRETAARLVRRIEPRTGSKMLAYQAVASGIGRSASWVRCLIARGIDRVDGDISRSLDAMLVRELEADARRLTEELEVARCRGGASCAQHVAEIEGLLSRARELLKQQ